MSLNFSKIPPQTTELAAFERLKNQFITLAPSFMIESFSFLQIRRTTIKSRLSSKFSLIGPCTAELAALECLKKIPIRLTMGESCEHSSALIFYWIFFILAENKDMHKSVDEFEFQPDPTTNYRVTCP